MDNRTNVISNINRPLTIVILLKGFMYLELYNSVSFRMSFILDSMMLSEI